MELRRNKRIELVPLTENNLEEEDSHLDEKILLETKIETLLKELENLNPVQKECMKLFYLKKMSYREITNSTTYSEKEVKSYIQNGKRNLKNQLIHHAEFRTEKRATRSA
jgi:RNA polymerase sigma-70 factor (ECF subfamily)